MNYKISNEFLTVEIAAKGGELQSIKSADGTEYLWQGDENTWKDRAINIFPYVARLTEGKYTFEGKTYHMNIHGFITEAELEVFAQAEEQITLGLHSNEETLACYPFVHTYSITYALVENKLLVTYQVENQDEKKMYFGLGGHPGFFVPLEEGLPFEDYALTFAEKAEPYRVGMSDTCFVTGEHTAFALEDGVKLSLRHDLFDQDAIVLGNMARQVTLKSEKGTRGVTVTYPDMDYLGIWHWPRVEINYVCIEPWTSLPSRDQVVEALEEQENLISLEAGMTYQNTWSIEIF